MLLELALCALQAPAAPAFVRYEVAASRSTVGFDGESTLHDFTGKTHAVAGELRCDPRSPEFLGAGTFTAEAKTFDTDNDSRDEEMRDVLDVEKHRQVVFRLDRVAGSLDGGRGKLVAHGRFTIKGVERAVDVALEVAPLADGALHVKGDAKIKLSSFGVEPPSFLFVSVEDKMRLWLDLVLAPKQEAAEPGALREIEITRDGAKPVRERIASTASSVAWTSPSMACTFVADAAGTRTFALASGDARAPEPADPRVTGAWARKELDQGFVLSCGSDEWLRVEGLAGDGSFCAAFAGLDGVPDDVRRALVDVRGVPRTIVVRSRTSAGDRTRTVRVNAPQDAFLGRWMFEPRLWNASLQSGESKAKG